MPSTQSTTNTSRIRVCPYCGNPYPMITIPALWDIPARTIQSKSCGCEGEKQASEKFWHQYRVDERERALRKAGIPEIYWDIEEDATYLEAIEDGGLFIHGKVGRGKTWLAVATMKAWMNRNRYERAVFTDAMGFFSHIRKAYDTGDTEREAMWRFIGAKLLVFDDFGKGKPSEWALERIEDVVQERYVTGRPTIFTSQWSGAALIDRLAEGGSGESATAIVSRIVQKCKTVELTGPDRRMQSL